MSRRASAWVVYSQGQADNILSIAAFVGTDLIQELWLFRQSEAASA